MTTFPDLLAIFTLVTCDDTYLVQWPRLFSCWHRRWETESELDHPVLLCYSLSHHPSSKDLKLERAGQGDHTRPARPRSPQPGITRVTRLAQPHPNPAQHPSSPARPALPVSVCAGSRGVLVKISGARDIQSRPGHSHSVSEDEWAALLVSVSPVSGDEIKLSLLSSGVRWVSSSAAASPDECSVINAHQNSAL